MKTPRQIALLCLFALVLSGSAGAQAFLPFGHIAGGSDLLTGPASRMHASVGMTAAAVSSDAQYALLSGFLPVLRARTASAISVQEPVPPRVSLAENYPNPFIGQTLLRFTLARPAHAELAVYTLLGKRVAKLLQRELDAGSHTVRFEAGTLPSGLYICRLRADGTTVYGRMLLRR